MSGTHVNTGYDPAAYGDGCAVFYEQLYPRVPANLVAALECLAAGASALELGLATGRVARALTARGVEVHGIEASQAMLAQYRRHADHAAVSAIAGDITILPYRGGFGLVFALCATLELLPTRELQRRCLAEVARILRPGGWFFCELSGLEGADLRIDSEVPVATAQGVRAYRVSLLPIPRDACVAMMRESGLEPVPTESAPCSVAKLLSGAAHLLFRRTG